MSDQNIVKQVCKELGITQKELAERIGVHDVTVRNWASKGDIPEWAVKFLNLLIENHKNNEIIMKIKYFKDALQEIEKK